MWFIIQTNYNLNHYKNHSIGLQYQNNQKKLPRGGSFLVRFTKINASPQFFYQHFAMGQ